MLVSSNSIYNRPLSRNRHFGYKTRLDGHKQIMCAPSLGCIIYFEYIAYARPATFQDPKWRLRDKGLWTIQSLPTQQCHSNDQCVLSVQNQ